MPASDVFVYTKTLLRCKMLVGKVPQTPLFCIFQCRLRVPAGHFLSDDTFRVVENLHKVRCSFCQRSILHLFRDRRIQKQNAPFLHTLRKLFLRQQRSFSAYLRGSVRVQHIGSASTNADRFSVHFSISTRNTLRRTTGNRRTLATNFILTPSFCFQYMDRASGLALRYKSAFILPLLFTLPLFQQLDDGILHLFRGVAAGKVFPQGVVFDDNLVQFVLFFFSHDRKGNVI